MPPAEVAVEIREVAEAAGIADLRHAQRILFDQQAARLAHAHVVEVIDKGPAGFLPEEPAERLGRQVRERSGFRLADRSPEVLVYEAADTLQPPGLLQVERGQKAVAGQDRGRPPRQAGQPSSRPSSSSRRSRPQRSGSASNRRESRAADAPEKQTPRGARSRSKGPIRLISG